MARASPSVAKPKQKMGEIVQKGPCTLHKSADLLVLFVWLSFCYFRKKKEEEEEEDVGIIESAARRRLPASFLFSYSVDWEEEEEEEEEDLHGPPSRVSFRRTPLAIIQQQRRLIASAASTFEKKIIKMKFQCNFTSTRPPEGKRRREKTSN